MLRLIHQLPQASRFHAAVANDPEHVEAVIKAQGGQQQAYRPPLAEWDSAHEMLAMISDKLELLANITLRANGASPDKPSITPRPKTAFADVEQRIKVEKHEALVERILRAKRPVESPPED